MYSKLFRKRDASRSGRSKALDQSSSLPLETLEVAPLGLNTLVGKGQGGGSQGRIDMHRLERENVEGRQGQAVAANGHQPEYLQRRGEWQRNDGGRGRDEKMGK